MELIKQWLINISITLVFMTAVEMLVVENSFKKYVKFVLGLVLIVVVITPLISLMGNSDEKIIDSFTKYEQQLTLNQNNEIQTNQGEATKKKIVENLENNINSMLEKEFKNLDFDCEVNSEVNLNNFQISISSINVYVYDNGIKPIKKIEIGSNKPTEEARIKESDEIKKYLSSELEVEKGKIKIYSMK